MNDMLLLSSFPYFHAQDPNWEMVLLTLGYPHLNESNQDSPCMSKGLLKVALGFILLRMKINHDRFLFIPAYFSGGEGCICRKETLGTRRPEF